VRIAFVTSSRADFGILAPVIRALRDGGRHDVRLIATGTHLSLLHGRTIREIEANGFTVDATFDIVLADDSARAIARSMGLAVLGASEAIERVAPDLLVVLGDRFEILAVASAALLLHVPVAHLCGGDATEGALDDSIRHAITKLAHLHFTTHADATRRVLQLGEARERTHQVGHPAIDAILGHRSPPRAETLAALGVPADASLAVLTYHPPTAARTALDEELGALLTALDRRPALAVIATGSNADEGGARIDARLEAWASQRPRTRFVRSLGQRSFYDALRHAAVMAGNSSSGLLEAPTLRAPTLNIGARQDGRPRARSVFDAPRPSDVEAALERALALDCSDVSSPYGDGQSVARIVRVIDGIDDPRTLLSKSFRMMSSEDR
jgi:UDP-hydrolysing UDP-N-acetyl-D-glucosamine 2-epimerase